MLVIGLILSMFGIGLFWLIFTLAVYALPFCRIHDGDGGAFTAAPEFSAG